MREEVIEEEFDLPGEEGSGAPEKPKFERRDVIFFVSVIVLVALASFGLGRLSLEENQLAEIKFENVPMTASGDAPKFDQAGAIVTALEEKKPATSALQPINAGGAYVASKTGAKYHLPWCAGAKQIKEENKIWFATKADAEKAGYTPAANCKGI